jgi:hypothetical protein
MSESESQILHYTNGIYAGDLFISNIHREHKQRDWNIRRGGRSTPETLIMIDEYEVNYECKVILNINTILSSTQLTDEQIFHLYTNICDELANGPYRMYAFSTGYVYFGRYNNDDSLKFNFILNSRLLLDSQNKILPKSQHRDKIYEIVKQVALNQILTIVSK